MIFCVVARFLTTTAFNATGVFTPQGWTIATPIHGKEKAGVQLYTLSCVSKKVLFLKEKNLWHD